MTTSTTPRLLNSRDLRDAGVARRAIYTGDYIKVHHDLYLDGAADPLDPDVRMRIAAHIGKTQAHLGGWAAARCYEAQALRETGPPDSLHYFDGTVPWPDSDRKPAAVMLCMNRDAKVRKVEGIRPLRSDLDETDIVTLDGLSITSPHRTAFDLARTEPWWRAVAAVDRLAHLGIVGLPALRTYAEVMERRHGIRKASKAIRLADARAESPMETLTRIIWLDAGLPAPSVNEEIFDDDGRFVARVDLRDPTSLLVAEYDGGHHAGPARRQRDAARRQALEELGFTMVTITAADVATPSSRRLLKERLVRGRRMARGLPRGSR